MGIRRAAAALLLSAAAVVATATPAFADTELDASSPGQGGTLAGPRLVVLSFTGHVTLPANPITVTGGSGASWTIGKAIATGPVVRAPVQRIGPPGPYTLTYKVIAEDGDAVTGTVSFTLISADAGSTTSLPPPPIKATTPATPPGTAVSTGPHGAVHVVPDGSPGTAADAASTSDSGGIPPWVWILGAVVVLAIGLLQAFRVGRSR
jgi:copper resistance protein C